MMGIEWQSLLKVFNEWAWSEYGQRGDINWLDIDGKSLKNTLSRWKSFCPIAIAK
jgi:hypothetical protein